MTLARSFGHNSNADGIDERALANFILDFGNASDAPITHLQLQKILYFCHGWHIAREGIPLVKGQFEAWRNGPVLRSVYNEFRQAGARPIKSRAMMLDLQSGEKVIAAADFPVEIGDFMRTVARLYMGYSAYDLSSMTHAVESPWYEVVYATDGKVNLGQVISNEAIGRYFASDRAPMPRS